ncbi:hypothetical protein PCANB_002983 [Pneumocystis canis]|nr:hypothetical protein PCANB_002983 [Pneumocystis canis]
MDLIKQEFDEKLNKESLFHVNHSNDIVNPLSVEYTDSISLDNLILKQEMPTQKESDTSLSTSNQTLISPFIKLSTSDNMDLSFSSVETHSPSELPFDTQKTIQLFHSEYHKTLKMSENILQENFEKIYQNASNDKTIDWGIPPILRGILWQTITSSKNSDMEHIYRTLINQTAPNEKIIRRDLHRTFPKAILKAMEQYSYNI